MTPEQFVYWLQGYAEISMDSAPNKTEWQVIKDHLATVFKKVTPDRTITTPGITVPNTPPTHITPWWEWKPNTAPRYWTGDKEWPKPEVMCSVSSPMATDTNWSSGAGTAAYCFHLNSTQEKNLKLNRKSK